MAKAGVINELDENFLTCEVCRVQFDKPKILPCGHTFCQGCLEKWAEVKLNVSKSPGRSSCPRCRNTWPVPDGGVSELPTNFQMNSLIDFVVATRKGETEDSSVQLCQFCESLEATLVCAQCAKIACLNCGRGHKRISSTADHKVVTLKEFVGLQKSLCCDQHPGCPIQFFCKTCSLPICKECTTTVHCLPRHELVKLHEAAREFRDSIDGTIKEVTEKMKLYNQEEDIKRVQEQLTRSREKMIAKIQENSRDLVQSIQANERELLTTIDNFFEFKYGVLNSQLIEISGAREKLQEPFENLVTLMEKKTDPEIMIISEGIQAAQEKLDILLADTVQVQPKENAFLKYIPDSEYAKKVKQGKILINSAVACESSIENLSPCFQKNNEEIFQLITRDCHGMVVEQGGAAVRAEVVTGEGNTLRTLVVDNEDGTYDIKFTPLNTGAHRLEVFLFDQLVKEPVEVQINPRLPLNTAKVIGKKGDKIEQFNCPTGVAISRRTQDIYVADSENERIQVLDMNGQYKNHFSVNNDSGQRVKPWGLAFTSQGHLVISDKKSKSVCVTGTDGRLLRMFGKDELEDPCGVAVSRDDHVLVADWKGHCVKIFAPNGQLTDATIKCKARPHCVAVDGEKNIVISDSDNVQVFDFNGALLFKLQRPKGKSKKIFSGPRGVAVDSNGNIFVCDCDAHKIKMFSRAGHFLGRVDRKSSGVKSPFAISTFTTDTLYRLVVADNCSKVRILQAD